MHLRLGVLNSTACSSAIDNVAALGSDDPRFESQFEPKHFSVIEVPTPFLLLPGELKSHDVSYTIKCMIILAECFLRIIP